MKTKVKIKEQAQPQKELCRHFWVIDDPNGPVSRGKCKLCGAGKDFYNALPEFSPLKKGQNPLKLPELPPVKVDKQDNKRVVTRK
jgi:hypothetical protein